MECADPAIALLFCILISFASSGDVVSGIGVFGFGGIVDGVLEDEFDSHECSSSSLGLKALPYFAVGSSF